MSGTMGRYTVLGVFAQRDVEGRRGGHADVAGIGRTGLRHPGHHRDSLKWK